MSVLDDLDPDLADLTRPAGHPDHVDPTLAVLVDEAPPADEDWLYERKLDGVRIIAHRDNDDVRLVTRNGEDRTSHFVEITEALSHVTPDDVVLDGEVVAFDGSTTSFSRLQQRMGLADPDAARATGVRIHYYVFDVLHLDGHDVRELPLRTRKTLLKQAIQFADPLRFTPHRVGDGEPLRAAACDRGWEGLIAKRASDPYPGTRSRSWRKLKCVADQELVIGGWTEPTGERVGLGALLVGHHDDEGLRYAGKVGTGFDRATLEDLHQRLTGLARDESPFVDPPRGDDLHWVDPELVAEIAFTEWTNAGRLRHPVFKGLRDDKAAADVVRES